MSMKRLSAAVVVAGMAMSGSALAEETGTTDAGFYVYGGAGFAWADDMSAGGSTLEFDNGISLNGAIGYDWGVIGEVGNVRTDIEIFYDESDNDKFNNVSVGGSLEHTGVLVNAYVDFMPGEVLRPYVGLGVGVVETDLTISVGGFSASGSSEEFAYRLAAGVGFELFENVTVDLGYRYLDVDTNVSHDQHSVLAGLRFGF